MARSDWSLVTSISSSRFCPREPSGAFSGASRSRRGGRKGVFRAFSETVFSDDACVVSGVRPASRTAAIRPTRDVANLVRLARPSSSRPALSSASHLRSNCAANVATVRVSARAFSSSADAFASADSARFVATATAESRLRARASDASLAASATSNAPRASEIVTRSASTSAACSRAIAAASIGARLCSSRSRNTSLLQRSRSA
mmetsp:Transcript_4015/g.17813  ORF Transcript_4015/g.17813 Transcript_4015/m.17813 type:complete len:204 (+) Transcript_4015:1179-1790(+)